MNEFTVFELSSKFASWWCFYFLCTLKLKEVIGLKVGLEFWTILNWQFINKLMTLYNAFRPTSMKASEITKNTKSTCLLWSDSLQHACTPQLSNNAHDLGLECLRPRPRHWDKGQLWGQQRPQDKASKLGLLCIVHHNDRTVLTTNDTTFFTASSSPKSIVYTVRSTLVNYFGYWWLQMRFDCSKSSTYAQIKAHLWFSIND